MPGMNLERPWSSAGRRHAALLAVLVAGGCAPGCKKTVPGPPVEGLRPAEQERPNLVATVTLAPLDRTMGKVNTLSQKLSLPFAGKDLITMFTAQNDVTPEVLAHVDTTQPVAVAYVAAKGKDHAPVEAMAATLREDDGADKIAAALGQVQEKQRGARRLRRPSGASVWVASHRKTFLASSSFEGLAAAGALALEAQKVPADDVVFTVHPDAVARWRQTDVRTALAQFRKEAVDDQIAAAERRGGPVPGAAERVMIDATLEALTDPIAESSAGALSLNVDPERGIRVAARLDPKPGSALAKRMATPTPYAVDPALLAPGGGGGAVIGLWSVGPGPFWLDLYGKVFAAQAKAGLKGAAEVNRHYQAVRPLLTGAGSGTLRASRAGIGVDLLLPVAGPAPAAALDAVAALALSRGLVELLGEIYGRSAPEVRARREGATVRAELAFPVRDRPGDIGTALKAVAGSSTLTALVSTSGGRLLAVTEPEASARLAALTAAAMAPAGARAAAGGADLTAALAETRGRDGVFYIDLWAVARPALTAADTQAARMIGMISALPGFGNLKLPAVMSYQGGQRFEAELRLPMSALANVAAVMRPLMGIGAVPRP